MQGQVQTYATLTERVKLQHEKKSVSNLKSMQSKALSKYLLNVLRFSFHENNFFVGNKILLETRSVVITDTSSVHCFGQQAGWFRMINSETKLTQHTSKGECYF